MAIEEELRDRLSLIISKKGPLKKLILSFQDPSKGLTYKDQDSPLTLADLAVNRYLYECITSLFPDDGWISEENQEKWKEPKNGLYWVIDPIDGTKEFIAGIPHYCISVALFNANTSDILLGIIINPSTDQLFYTSKSTNRIKVKGSSAFKHLSNAILVSRTEVKLGLFNSWKNKFPIFAIGSIAYKLALVSSGIGSAVVSLRKKNIWDIMAGCFLCQKAGLRISTLKGEPMAFSADKLKYDGLIVSNESAYEDILMLISSIK